MTSLPTTAPLQVYLRAAALSKPAEFLRALPGVGAFVRLDERGGHDEPARFAFEALVRAIPEHGDDDVFVDPLMAAGGDEATATGPAQPPLPMPAARELATVVVLPRGGGRIGRGPSSVVRIAERSVSRQHAMIAVDEDATVDAAATSAFSVVDLDSDNGTAVNGVLLEPGAPQRLRSGDVLQVADVVLLFLDGQAFLSHLPALGG